MTVVLNRDSIRAGFVQKIAEDAERLGLLTRLSGEELVRSREETMASAPAEAKDVWVFAYGSLMWNPAFHTIASAPARLYGHHRAFCLLAVMGRGTPDRPGLILGLERGGSCRGLALKVDPDRLEEELDVVWAREMVTGAYKPTWVRLYTADGPVWGIAFVMDRRYERYVSDLTQEQTARMIADAEGELGRCSDYLANTVTALDGLGILDGPMHRLMERVRELQGQKADALEGVSA